MFFTQLNLQQILETRQTVITLQLEHSFGAFIQCINHSSNVFASASNMAQTSQPFENNAQRHIKTTCNSGPLNHLKPLIFEALVDK